MLSVYYNVWYKEIMTRTLTTATAIFVFAFFLSACQPDTSSQPVETQEIQVIQTPQTQESEKTEEQTTEQGTVVSTTATYQSPAGPEEVGFSLTLDSQGTILSAETTVLAVSPTSKMRQNSFADALPAAIEGKELASLGAIDRVGGSSLTTRAFNVALAEMQSQL